MGAVIRAVTAAAALAALIPAAATAATAAPVVSGHRAATGVPGVPESSLQAVAYAAEHGAHAIEFDVRWTRDGYMVVLHDHTLDRTTDCTGPVEALTFAQLRRCADYRTVPAFTNVLKAAKAAGLTVNPELKPVPGYPLTTAKAAAYVKRINTYGMASRTVVSSTSLAILQRVRAQPATRLMRFSLITGPGRLLTPAEARKGGTVYMPDYRMLTAAKVAAFHAAGVKLWAWPARGPADYAPMRSLGVDVIVADDPRDAVRWLEAA